MGLSVVIGGSIVMMIIILTVSLTYVGTYQIFTQSIANSEINNIENEISKTDIKISSLDGCSDSNIVNFTLANNGIRKLSNYDQFNLVVTYDAQTGGPADPVRVTEQFVYNADAFSASTAIPPQEKEIPHTYVEVTSRQSTQSAVFVDIPGGILNSIDFDIDKKYLIYATTQFNMNDGSESGSIRLAHAGVGFTGSEYSLDPLGGDPYYTYTWFTVWNPTTVAQANQDVTLQFQRTTTDGGSDNVRIEQVTLFAMEISEHLTEDTDWFFDEDATAAQALPNAWTAVNNAARTFTPDCPNDEWLVMATAQLNTASNGLNYETRLQATGGVTNSVDHLSREGEDTANDLIIQTIVHTYTIPAVATTFTSQSQNDGGGISGTREYSAIFAINLDKFKDHKSVSELGKLDVSTIPDFVTEVQSLTFTPEESGDAWILGYFIMNGNNGNGFHARMQSYETGKSEVDTPSSQTIDLLRLSRQWDGSDELAFAIQTVERLNSVSYTVDIDADTFSNTNTGYDAEARVINFVSMITEECVGGDPDSLLQINEWTINCIMNDNFEPGIINTHESAQISLKTEYPIFPGGMLEASISTDNGSTDSKIILTQ